MGAGASTTSLPALENERISKVVSGMFPLSKETAEMIRSAIASHGNELETTVFSTTLSACLATDVTEENVKDLCAQFQNRDGTTIDASAALNFFTAAGEKFLDVDFLPCLSSLHASS